MTNNSSRVRDYEILEVFADTNDPVLSTSEVADQFDIGTAGMNYRLEKLEKEGHLKSKNAGNAKVWWHASLCDHLEDISIDVERYTIGVEVIDSLDIPGDDEQLKARRQAVSEIYQLIFEQEEVKSPFLKERSVELVSGTGYQGTSIWDHCVRPSLGQTILFDHSRSSPSATGIHDAVDWWYLTNTARRLKETYGENALWENWDDRRKAWEHTLKSELWDSIFQYTKQEGIPLEKPPYSKKKEFKASLDSQLALLFSYDLTDHIWFSSSGTLTLEIEVEPESTVPNQAEFQLKSLCDFPVEIEQVIPQAFAKQTTLGSNYYRISTTMDIDPQSNSIPRDDLQQIFGRLQTIREAIQEYF